MLRESFTRIGFCCARSLAFARFLRKAISLTHENILHLFEGSPRTAMNEVLIVKNISREGPGLIELLLKARKIHHRIIDLERGEKFSNPESYRAVVVLGGPDSANDSTEKMKLELTQIEEIIRTGTPYLGICLGMQALIKAAGGEVHKHTMKEIGWRDPDGGYFEIELTQEGREDPLFQGLSS